MTFENQTIYEMENKVRQAVANGDVQAYISIETDKWSNADVLAIYQVMKDNSLPHFIVSTNILHPVRDLDHSHKRTYYIKVLAGILDVSTLIIDFETKFEGTVRIVKIQAGYMTFFAEKGVVWVWREEEP